MIAIIKRGVFIPYNVVSVLEVRSGIAHKEVAIFFILVYILVFVFHVKVSIANCEGKYIALILSRLLACSYEKRHLSWLGLYINIYKYWC